jgi:hypothetical protein
VLKPISCRLRHGTRLEFVDRLLSNCVSRILIFTSLPAADKSGDRGAHWTRISASILTDDRLYEMTITPRGTLYTPSVQQAGD